MLQVEGIPHLQAGSLSGSVKTGSESSGAETINTHRPLVPSLSDTV